jgi:hypothetical protein
MQMFSKPHPIADVTRNLLQMLIHARLNANQHTTSRLLRGLSRFFDEPEFTQGTAQRPRNGRFRNLHVPPRTHQSEFFLAWTFRALATVLPYALTSNPNSTRRGRLALCPFLVDSQAMSFCSSWMFSGRGRRQSYSSQFRGVPIDFPSVLDSPDRCIVLQAVPRVEKCIVINGDFSQPSSIFPSSSASASVILPPPPLLFPLR